MNYIKAIVAITGFWMFFYAHPNRPVHTSMAFDTQAACEQAASDQYTKGWDVSNCRDSDNLQATQD